MAEQVLRDNPIQRNSNQSGQMRQGHASNKRTHRYVGKESLQAALAAADRVNVDGKMIRYNQVICSCVLNRCTGISCLRHGRSAC